MSKIAVIYCSKTGFSARYARWMAAELHADLYRYKTVDTALLASYETIIYGAGFYAGKLKGARWFMRIVRPLSSAHIIVFATGSMPRVRPQDLQQEWDMSFRRREQEQIHLFYLPGGMNYARLSPPSRLLMRLYRFYMLHSPKTQPDTRKLMRRLDRSVDYTDRKAIQPILTEAQKKKPQYSENTEVLLR